MKTALVTACFLEGEDVSGTSRLERNIRYVNYYDAIKTELGFDDIWLLDNASDEALLAQLPKAANIHRYSERLMGSDRKHDYPYCWRALYDFQLLIDKGYEKIIAIDSDCFVLTKKLAKHIRESNSGWITYWNEVHRFPEAALQILNKDAFDLFRGYTSKPWQERNDGRLMERDIPFTVVEMGFRVGRFAEQRLGQEDWMDAIGQAGGTTKAEYEK